MKRIAVSNLDNCVAQNGVSINFSWCHARRRTIGMTVRPDKTVSVRAPLRTSVADIHDFVIKHFAWILKVWQKMDSRQPKADQCYHDGSIFLFQGKEYRLLAGEGGAESIQLLDGFMMVTTVKPSEVRIRGIIDCWYRDQAAQLFAERSVVCHRLMASENIPLPRIVIRPMKSRWGSYSYRTKRINLNLNLIQSEQSCLDYVIIHELCHIRIRHHGPDFWNMVGRYVPDYLELRRKLRLFDLS